MASRSDRIFVAVMWLTAVVLGVGILVMDWPEVLVFVVPFFGAPLLLAVLDRIYRNPPAHRDA